MLKILKIAIPSLLLLLVIFALFNLKTIKRLYKVIHFFDKEVIVNNFRTVDENFEVTRLTPSAAPNALPKGEAIQIPASFTFEGEVINTAAFLEEYQMEGLMVIQNDTVVYEEYRKGLVADETHIAWSMSKSVVATLLGMAHDDGLFELGEPVTKYLPQFKGTGYDGVRIKDILQMSSGVGFNEDYGDFNSDINRFGRTFALGTSFEKFALSLKQEREPGTYNQYVSIDTQVLGMLLQKVTGKTLTSYYQERLWEPLGMQDHGEWVIDNTGMEMALGGLNMTMRDFAKIGLLYLHKGKYKEQQIVSAEWIKMATTPDASHLMPGARDNAKHVQGYGFQWWIPTKDEGDYFATGIYDQYIYVQPAKNTVIVILSANYHFKDRVRGGERKHVAFFKEVCEAI